MNLAEYLFQNGMSARSFAKSIDYEYNYVCLIKRKRMRPGPKLRRAIKKATDGAVTEFPLETKVQQAPSNYAHKHAKEVYKAPEYRVRA